MPDGAPPDFSGDTTDGTTGDQIQGQIPSLLLMGGSAAVLLAGLAFALLYKRRK